MHLTGGLEMVLTYIIECYLLMPLGLLIWTSVQIPPFYPLSTLTVTASLQNNMEGTETGCHPLNGISW